MNRSQLRVVGRLLFFYHLVLTLIKLHIVSTALVSGGDCFEKIKNLNENDFKLKCTPDGYYERIQCDNGTGYCFCVDEKTGIYQNDEQLMPIKDRRLFECGTRRNRPDNDRYHSDGSQRVKNSATTGRSRGGSYAFASLSKSQSKQPTSVLDIGSGGDRQRRTRGCRIGPRINFLVNLIELIRRERQHKLNQQQLMKPKSFFIPGIHGPPAVVASPPVPSANVEDDEAILRTKFHQLDTNGDHRLWPIELRVYLQRVMGNVTPSGSQYAYCARTLFTFCDRDRDQVLNQIEFADCLNISKSKDTNKQWMQNRQYLRKNKGLGALAEPWQTRQPSSSSSRNQQMDAPVSLSSGSGNLPRFTLPVPEAGAPQSHRRAGPDCLSVQSDALESASDPAKVRSGQAGGPQFIPNCTSEGYYLPIQCHDAATCWCVSKNTGTPMKRFSENSTRTQTLCERMRKGCNQERRRSFHVRLRQVLAARKLSCTAAFRFVDADADGRLTKSEWSNFERQLWSKWSTAMPAAATKNRSGKDGGGLKAARRIEKCFRTEVSFCDEDGDDRLSQDEWLTCCERSRGGLNSGVGNSGGKLSHSFTTATYAKVDGRSQRPIGEGKGRSGPNPFLTILRPD